MPNFCQDVQGKENCERQNSFVLLTFVSKHRGSKIAESLLKRVAAKWARTDSAANQFGALRAHKPIAASSVVAPPCAAARRFLEEDSDHELL